MNAYKFSTAVVVMTGSLFFSSFSYAQEGPPCDLEPGQTDSNNDGYADQFVSPSATVITSEIDCTAHAVMSNSVISNSTLLNRVTVERRAKVNNSILQDDSVIKLFAQVQNSSVLDRSTIGAGSYVSNSSISRDSRLERRVFVEASSVENSEIRQNTSVTNGSVLREVILWHGNKFRR